jgi:hypothetical protein
MTLVYLELLVGPGEDRQLFKSHGIAYLQYKHRVKGDPYRITDSGRLKLSNAENVSTTNKSNLSKASPSPLIWTLPDPSLMSSPIPHTYQFLDFIHWVGEKAKAR